MSESPGQFSDRDPDPARVEYPRRLAARRAEVVRRLQQERRISMARLVFFLAIVGVALVAFDTGRVSPWWISIPVTAFAGLVAAHDRVITARRRAERGVAFYERGVGRLEDRWIGTGDAGERFLDPHHPYAADLDVFGRGSLFELLCTARTQAGEATLAAWLCAAATPQDVRARQAAVAELRPRLEFREALALLGDDVRAGLDADALTAWGAAPPVLTGTTWRVVTAGLAALVIVTAFLWAVGAAGPLPLLVVLVAQGSIATRLRSRIAHVIQTAQHPDRELALFGQLLSGLEGEHWESPHLTALRARLATAGEPPSRRIARLHRLIHLLDARKNQLFGPLSGLVLWTTQLGLAIEAWRVATGPAIGRWLSVVGEIEALNALAGFAFEHPDNPFPEIVETGPLFDATELGHPLIPPGRCVRNDVRVGADRRALIVSGSNMSGKSTCLRSVGTNTVLALAGAPVCAQRLRLSPLALGASIRTLDSLQDGTSRFYAEITRLRQLMDLTKGELPLLFLLDEILHGTNSHDRGIGAEAVVRGFVTRGAIGIVTTHDLALTRLAQTLPHAVNVHFEDHLENGTMRFDYRMRPGVVTKSNALALMRAVGLEV
jgi:hypothetical protein